VHLAAAREQVRVLNQQAENEEQLAKRQVQPSGVQRGSEPVGWSGFARSRTAPARKSARPQNLCGARLQHRPEAHVMRNGEGGTVPSYNVQLVTDTQHGLVVNVEATTDAIDYRQLDPLSNVANRN